MSDAELPPVGIVFFDLGNVLVRFDAQRGCANLAAIANCDTAKVKEVVYDSGLQWRYEAGELSCQAFADIVNAGLGSQLASERLLSALADMFVVDPGAFSIISKLLTSEIRVGLLSNTCAAHWRHLRLHLNIQVLDLLSPIVLSYEVNAIKPNSRIYERAAEIACVAPESILFTDDRPENVEAGRQARWRCHQYDNPHDLAKWLSHQGLPVFV